MRPRILWLEAAVVVVGLTMAELTALIMELQSSLILDWFVSLAPLLWINGSVLFVYVLLRGVTLPQGAAEVPTGGWRLLHPELSAVRQVLSRPPLRAFAVGAGLAYALAFALLQGLLVVDLAGSIRPFFTVLRSPVGYGPGVAWAPTAYVGVVLRPYTLAAAVSLALLSSVVLSLFAYLLRHGRGALRALPGPMAGLAVMCPACFATPAAGLFLAYLAPAATLVGLGTVPLFTLTLAVATVLLLLSLLVLWMTMAWLTRLLADGHSRPRGP